MRVLGIDEAGRGCVLGDLVVGGFLSELADAVLAEAGATDSKKLSAKRRGSARDALRPLGEPHLVRITPAQIDTGNLNRLEEEAICEIIRHFRPDHVIIDALGHPSTLPAIVARLQAALPDIRCTFLMEPKADLNHAVCGAASIFAKLARDEALADHGLPLGSGYPSDPKTRAWLTEHARTRQPWPPFVRTRWQTVRDLAQIDLLD